MGKRPRNLYLGLRNLRRSHVQLYLAQPFLKLPEIDSQLLFAVFKYVQPPGEKRVCSCYRRSHKVKIDPDLTSLLPHLTRILFACHFLRNTNHISFI